MVAAYVLMTFFFGVLVWFMCRRNKELEAFSREMIWAFAKSIAAILVAGVAAGLLLLTVILLTQAFMFETGKLMFAEADLMTVMSDVIAYIGSTLVSLYLVFAALQYKKKK